MMRRRRAFDPPGGVDKARRRSWVRALRPASRPAFSESPARVATSAARASREPGSRRAVWMRGRTAPDRRGFGRRLLPPRCVSAAAARRGLGRAAARAGMGGRHGDGVAGRFALPGPGRRRRGPRSRNVYGAAAAPSRLRRGRSARLHQALCFGAGGGAADDGAFV